jgi:SAM-dependent methyltransferase
MEAFPFAVTKPWRESSNRELGKSFAKTLSRWLNRRLMMQMTSTPGHSKRITCRLCDSPRLEMAVPLRPTPIADAFVTAAEKEKPQPLYPLDLYFCSDCSHLQLLDVVDPELLFSNYLYVTETSPGLVEHFNRYCEDVCQRFPFSPGKLMVEMGSNAGVLLRYFQKKGFKVLGVDPAREIARQATENGLETLPTFFNFELAKKIRAERGAASLFAANNVFAHSDDLGGMAKGIAHLLADDGVFVFEVSYLVDVVEKMLFDTVYHEHLSFHSVKPLQKFLKRYGLELIDVQRIAPKGGSIRCFAQRAGGPRPVEPSVKEILDYEVSHGFDKAETFREYGAKIANRRDQVLAILKTFKDKGQLIMGFGAAPATTTLTYQFELNSLLAAIVDDNPRKQGRFSPGDHIPILPASALAERKPACVVILAWIYADRIIANNPQVAEWGGQFLVPLPEPKLVSAS